jgi:hypothetical protein
MYIHLTQKLGSGDPSLNITNMIEEAKKKNEESQETSRNDKNCIEY